MFAENIDYEILSPSGWKDFRGITVTLNKETTSIGFSDGSIVTATENHYFFKQGKKTQLKELTVGDSIDIIDGSISIISIIKNVAESVFDIVEVDDQEHRFIVNEKIITKNCDEFAFVRPTIAKEFWTSISPTLSTGGKAIITSTPSSDEDQFATIWKQANKCIDEFGNPTKLGVNGFKAFQSHWREHPDRDDKWAEEEKGRIGDERFRREHNCLAQTSVVTIKWPDGAIRDVSISELEKLLS